MADLTPPSVPPQQQQSSQTPTHSYPLPQSPPPSQSPPPVPPHHQQLQDVKHNMPPAPLSHTLTINTHNASRRPPRKSTLTQQQKNQKRQRATQDQLMTLEVEFNKNPTPTAMVRERIAGDINMTERSVQIWFQNRRAKIKNIAKRSIENGEDCDSIPESMRQYLAMQAYGPGKVFGPGMMGRAGPNCYPYGNSTLCLNTDASSGKVVIQHFHCRSLAIGSWRRVGQSTMDLVIFYSPDKACVTYYIHNDSAGYKIEYPFASIKNITLEQGDVLAAAEGASNRSGGLIIELTRPPKFYMDSSGSGGFYECRDFTEDQQASQILVHHLGGPSKVLSGQLAKLVSLEAYQNRHHVFDPSAFIVSAPVSPIGHRPASQPNHMMHPHNGMHLFSPQDPMAGLMGPPGPRGHKRQRSRSVPVAVDLSMLRQPMPSFVIQHDCQPAQAPMHDSNIFAPIPQHQPHGGFAPGPMGPHLTVDTSAGYGMGINFNGPLSATTANTPSEFGTPAFFAPGPSPHDNMHAPFHASFDGFLTVDSAAIIGTSNTPLSVTSHGDPVIADHSPPFNGIGRSQSVDVFATGDHTHMSDDSAFLAENFHKQITLPLRSPMSDGAPFQSPMPDGMFTFQSPSIGPQQTPHMGMNGQQPHLGFHSSPHSGPDGSVFQSTPPHPHQMHQDGAIAFSTPSHMPQDHSAVFQGPDDSLLYQDAKAFSSPDQMTSMPEDQVYHHSPLDNESLGPRSDFQSQQIYSFVDPNSLSQ